MVRLILTVILILFIMSDRTYIYETPNQSVDAATAALLAGRNNNGGLFGSNGLEGLIGLIIAAGIFGGGNGNGWFGGGNNNNTEREKVSQQATAINNYQQTQTFAAMLQPISASLAGLHSEVDDIKCKLPKTEVVNVNPDYVPINRGINVNYAPYSCLTGFGFPYGFNNGNGSFF